MKKLLCMMMLATVAGSSMAQNSAIKKAQTLFQESAVSEQYTNAEGLKAQRTVINWDKLQQAQDVLTPAFTNEKTKDFALAWQVQGDIYQRHMANELNKAVDQQELDTMKLFTMLNKTLDAYYECVKADAKGQYKLTVQPNFQKFRLYYMYCGQFFSQNNDPVHSLQAFDLWLTFPERYSQIDPMFMDMSQGDIDPAQVAYYCALTAYQSKAFDLMAKYQEQAYTYEKDAVTAHQLYLQAAIESGDTAKWEAMAEQYAMEGTAGDGVVQNLLAHYFGKNDEAKTLQFAQMICDQRPDDKLGPYAQGLILMNKEKYMEAHAWFDKALAIDPEYFDALFNAGVCLCNEGYNINDAMNGKKMTKAENDAELEKVKAKYREAEPYFLKIRELRPEETNRWANRLRTIYYIIGDKEKEAEMEAYCN